MADSDSDQELFPIENQEYFLTFSYDDPLSVSGVLRAVVEEDLEKVKKLLEDGKSANINDNHGNTPLHVAVIKNLPDIVDFLLTLDEVTVNGRNFYGETPLFVAVKRGYSHLVEKLISAKCNVNLSNFEDVTPLHLSVKFPEVAHLLIKNGAKIDAVDYSGETPLHEAVNEQCLETICMLLYYGADANIECSNQITPFMKAVILENLEIQEILLEYVVDFNTCTKDGMSLLNLALTHACVGVKELIDRGANVNYKHSVLNAFLICLQVPDAHNFSLIWKNFKFQKLFGETTYLEFMVNALGNNDLYEYLRIIINSGNLEPIFVDFDLDRFFRLLSEKVADRQPWLKIVSDLICLYLCHGYTLTSGIIAGLYGLFGYNELLYICLHMDVRESQTIDLNFSRILYDTRLTVNDFKLIVSRWNRDEEVDMIPFLPYMSLVGYHECTELCQRAHEGLCQFPSLLELSRNATRDSLIRKFNMSCCKEYYLYVRHLPIAAVYKDILMFKTPVYIINA